MLAGAGRGERHLAGRDPRAVDEPHTPATVKLLVEDAKGNLSLGSGSDGSQSIVLAGRCEPEDRDDRVAYDLLDRPAVRLEDQPHRVEVEGQDPEQRLRVELLAEGGGALEVRNGDRDCAADLRRWATGDQRRAAVAAHWVGARVLLAAVVADVHNAILRCTASLECTRAYGRCALFRTKLRRCPQGRTSEGCLPHRLARVDRRPITAQLPASEWQRPLRFIFVVIVIVVGAAFIVVGVDVSAARAGLALVVVIVVVIHRRDGLGRVLVG